MSDPTTTSDSVSVLIVDDEQGLADLYALYLDEGYDTRTAYDGESALDMIDDTVDVILLDRRMPGLSGDEVLAELRNQEFDQPVGMLTAVDPGDDILEMNFDDYFLKPIDEEELRAAVDTLAKRAQYDTDFREYFAAVSKKAAMEANSSKQDLTESEAYQQLEQEVEAAKADADTTFDELKREDPTAGFRDL
ncbi:hypothetical protein AMR74_14665 [Halorubrum tropicale]|uniref:Response regulatory domain-containing protein n=2 Tax=Halorubrum tropicale TaxID=1765655 RepID=A0A0M9AN95_9EURY|nr:hypothetical protein AMR74_14665 [Halorubrum tropicale]